MWVALDLDQRGLPASVGSGIVGKYVPIAEYSLQALLAPSTGEGRPATEQRPKIRHGSICGGDV